MPKHDPLKVLISSTQKLLRRGHDEHLRNLLSAARPADLAALFTFIPGGEHPRLFGFIEDTTTRAEVLSELGDAILPGFLEHLEDADLVTLLELMPSDDTADVLDCLPEERKLDLLRQMSREEQSEAQDLLRYDPDTAGGIMVPDFFALDEDTTCDATIDALRKVHDDLEMVFYTYVVNSHGHLVGVLSLRQVVTAPADTPLRDVMEPEVVRVAIDDDQETVAELVARYNLLALPVVDRTNRLVGIITVDDVIDVIREEATEDMFRMAGAGEAPEGVGLASVLRSTRSRLPWLFASWLGGVGAGVIIHSYEARLIKMAALASFIPVIIGMAGNVGTQSLTVVTRGLALGEIPKSQLWRVLSREVLIGVVCGVIYGVLLGVTSAMMTGQPAVPIDLVNFGLTIGIALCAAMIIAATVGGFVPMVLHRLSIDPAVATGPFVTTSVDILGIIVYFQLASFLLGI